jgi:hypothetical protein
MDRSVLTIATGKPVYLELAINLARSFFLWHHDHDIIFQLVTDLRKEDIPIDIREKIQIISIMPGELGAGFSPKLHLDKLASEGQTLFIDSDCLIYKHLGGIFDRFRHHSVSVVGEYISAGEWFGDVAAICRQFNLPHLPKFNGGVYYLEKGPTAAKVYQTARELEKRYDEIGFIRLRNRPNDEVLMAVSMQLNQQIPIADDGDILGELVNFQSGIESDLLNGIAELHNNPKHSLYQPQWHLKIAKPAIVHYLGDQNKKMPYVREARLLKYLFENKRSLLIARLSTFCQITVPIKTVVFIKDIFRPLYRGLFGTRKVAKSERIVD